MQPRFTSPWARLFASIAVCLLFLLGLAGTQAGTSATVKPQSAQPSVLDLGPYQLPSGLIQTFVGGTVADPYFGLFSLELARNAGLDVRAVSERFIAWGLSEQKSDGRFDRYCRTAEQWQACGRADSDDATLARWIELLHHSAAGPLDPKRAQSVAKAEAALNQLKMANGVYSVFLPGTKGYDGYALFLDNVEVLGVLERMPALLRARGNEQAALRYAQEAKSLRQAITKVFGADKPMGIKRLVVGANYDKPRFYPHAIATPVGWLEGFFAAPTPAQWELWLIKHDADWSKNAEKDFPWGILAVAALRSGPPEVAACWLERNRAQRAQLVRWNVLEEAAFKVIESAKPALGNCPWAPPPGVKTPPTSALSF